MNLLNKFKFEKENEMTITVKLADGTIVTGEKVAAEKKVPAKLKVYRVLEGCPLSFKGKQRQAVADALRTKSSEFLSREQVAEIAGDKIKTKFAPAESAGWHLHQLELLGFVESK